MKRCPTSLVTREMQIKTTMRYHFTPTKKAIIKKTITDISKDVEKLEPSYITGGNAQWCSTLESSWQFLKTFSTELPCNPAIPLVGIN